MSEAEEQTISLRFRCENGEKMNVLKLLIQGWTTSPWQMAEVYPRTCLNPVPVDCSPGGHTTVRETSPATLCNLPHVGENVKLREKFLRKIFSILPNRYFDGVYRSPKRPPSEFQEAEFFRSGFPVEFIPIKPPRIIAAPIRWKAWTASPRQKLPT